MKKFWKVMNANPIISSIIASFLFVTLVSPFTTPLAEQIPRLVGYLPKIFYSVVFMSAAQSSLYSFIIQLSLTMFLVIIFNLCYLSVLGKKRLKIKVAALLPNNVEKCEVSKKESEEENAEKVPENNNIKKSLFAYNTLIVLAMFTLVLYTFVTFIPCLLHIVFLDSITLISPYTTDDVIKVLNSKWIQMKGYSDYQEIYQVINEIRNAAGI